MATSDRIDRARPAWFWSERWQQMEHQVDEHIARGEVGRHDDADRFLSFLDDIEPDA